MFAAQQDRVRIDHFVLGERSQDPKKRKVPTVMRGVHIPLHFEGTNYETPEPCSLNVIIEQFYDKEKKPKTFPFVLHPEEEVVGRTGLIYKKGPIVSREHGFLGTFEDILCVETRSRHAARRGFTCLGFYDGTKVDPFYTEAGEIDLLFRNELPLPVVVTEPFSPAQVWIITNVDPRTKELNDTITLMQGEENVTNKNRVQAGDMKTYLVHLGRESDGTEIKYFKPQKEAVPLTELERIMKKARFEDIDPTLLDFSLTITQETVATNGCPVYMFPFHARDIIHDFLGIRVISGMLESREEGVQLYKKAFIERKAMPITANAGLHNPGCSAQIIFENITRGRNISRELFRAGEPFGVVMPVPFYDGGIDTRYRKDNRGISLNN